MCLGHPTSCQQFVIFPSQVILSSWFDSCQSCSVLHACLSVPRPTCQLQGHCFYLLYCLKCLNSLSLSHFDTLPLWSNNVWIRKTCKYESVKSKQTFHECFQSGNMTIKIDTTLSQEWTHFTKEQTCSRTQEENHSSLLNSVYFYTFRWALPHLLDKTTLKLESQELCLTVGMLYWGSGTAWTDNSKWRRLWKQNTLVHLYI